MFVHGSFDPLKLLARMQEHGPVESDQWSEGTLNCVSVRSSFSFSRLPDSDGSSVAGRSVRWLSAHSPMSSRPS